MITICGWMEGWDVTKCRTLGILEAMEVWGDWFPLIADTNEKARLKVGPYQVWAL